MKKINYGTFEKDFLKQGKTTSYLVAPYFNFETHSAKSIYVSNDVEEVTEVTYRGKKIGLLIPTSGSLKEALSTQFEALQNHVRVMCPVLSIFDESHQKILQLSQG